MDVVTFETDDRDFLMEVARVREVVASPEIERSKAPDAIDGWMALRGDRVPVIDLRTRLGVAAAGGPGAVLVVDHPAGAFGVRVDVVREVRSSVDDRVLAVPSYFRGGAGWLRGLVARGDRLAMLVDAAALWGAGSAGTAAGA